MNLRTPVIVGALVVAGVGGCGSDPVRPEGEPAEQSSAAIQGGSADTTHSFAVAVVQKVGSRVALCSGVLLGPNLVATARHCVSQLASPQIDCATSQFGATVPSSDIFVTPLPTVPNGAGGAFYGLVANGGLVVPAESPVCGNDIALLILASGIQLPQYVTPTVAPPMTDHHAYTTSYAAIGYGVSSPTDTNGTSAGSRRIKENIRLSCIPNDKTFVDCFSYANAQQYIDAKEFEGGDGTCEGDSGSAAFDEGSFAMGQWAAFGLLSRGGVSPEGGTCQGAIYTRFDAWAQLLASTAIDAAARGNYPPPGWATAALAAGDSGAASSAGAGSLACRGNGTTCSSDSQCCSVNCLSFDMGATYSCVACDSFAMCGPGYGCQQGACILGARSSLPGAAGDGGANDGGEQPSHTGGCAVAPGGSSDGWPWPTLAVLLGCAAALVRRRQVTHVGGPQDHREHKVTS